MGLAGTLGLCCRRVKAKAQCSDNAQDSSEFWVASGRKRLVQTLPSEARLSGELCHSLRSGNVAQSGRYERSIALFQRGFEVRGHVILGLKMFGGIPLSSFSLDHLNSPNISERAS